MNFNKNVNRPNAQIQSNNRQFQGNMANAPPKVVTEIVKQNANAKKRIRVTITLADQTTFTVHTEWDEKLMQVLRKQSMKSDKQLYWFPLSRYKEILSIVKQQPHLDVNVEGEIPAFVPEILTHFRALREKDDEIDLRDKIEATTV